MKRVSIIPTSLVGFRGHIQKEKEQDKPLKFAEEISMKHKKPDRAVRLFKRALHISLLLVLPLLFSGCFAAMEAGIIAVLAQKDGGGSHNAPPESRILSTMNRSEFPDPDHIELRYRLSDDRATTLDINVEYAIEGGAFVDATEAASPLSEGKTGLSASQGGIEHVFVWDAGADLGGGAATVKLRITPLEGAVAGKADETTSFVAGNEPPTIDIAPLEGSKVGDIFIEYKIIDHSKDFVAIDVEYLTEDATEWTKATLRGERESLESDASPGEPHSIAWNSLADLGTSYNENVFIRMRGKDWEYGEFRSSDASFIVDNNSDPFATIVIPADECREIAIRYRLFDGEANPIKAVFQYSLKGEPFPALPETSEYIELILGHPWIRQRLRICTEADTYVTGMADGGTHNTIRDTDFVQKGLCYKIDATPFLVGKVVEITKDITSLVQWDASRIITSVDASASTITVDATFPYPVDATTGWRIRANEGMINLASSASGILHSFIWDSFKDTSYDTLKNVNIRITPYDSQRGTPVSFEIPYKVSNGLLSLSPQSPLAAGQFPTSIAIGDLSGDGKKDLACSNKGDDNIILYHQQQDGTLALHSPLDASSEPFSIAIADLNGDASPDLVCANYKSDNISIYYQQPDGKLELQFSLATGASPISVAIGDLNGDASPDLACANWSDDNITVYLQEEDGTFSLQPPLDASNMPRSVAIGDLNGDASPDLACANYNGRNITLYLQQADGTLQPSPQSPLDAGILPYAAGIGDLNGDGLYDLACVDYLGKTIFVYLQDATSHMLSLSTQLSCADEPESLTIGDLNGDGRMDLAFATTGNSIILYLQQEDGTLAEIPQSPAPVGTRPSSLAIGDLNGDGSMDIASANQFGNDITLYLQQPDGKLELSPQSPIPAELKPDPAAIGDLNGDGRMDIAFQTHEQTIAVYHQQADGILGPSLQSPLDATRFIQALAIGDLNGDGKMDLACAIANDYYNRKYIYYYTQVNGTLTLQPPLDTSDNPTSIALGDLDGDGKLDLACANRDSDNITVYLQRSTGLELQPPLDTTRTPNSVAIGDLNGDGRDDLACANMEAHQITIFLQDPISGALVEPPQSPLDVSGIRPISVAIGDLNGDGRQDLACANYNTRNINVFYQQEDGTLPTVPQLSLATGYFPDSVFPHSVAIGDLNGDGRMDLACANKGNNNITVFLQQEGGTLSEPAWSPLAVDIEPHEIAIGDLNGDGIMDLVCTNFQSYTLTIYLQR
jgi:6-phosphogluconolactonase (cycloisomerase 2 family)